MENKQSMIEEWAKKVEHSKKQELSIEAVKRFMTICVYAKKIDEDQELIADLENKRHRTGSAFWGIIKCLPSPYRKSQRHKWASLWSTDPNDPLPEGAIELPKGTIKILTGKDLTWKDEPIELNEDLLLRRKSVLSNLITIT